MKTVDELLAEWDLEVVLSPDIIALGMIPGGSIDINARKALIKISSRQSLKERVVTFFHELLHLDPERDPITVPNSTIRTSVQNFGILGKIEESVEREAYRIYEERLDLVKYAIREFNLNNGILLYHESV